MGEGSKLKVITLCGSTKFKKQFREAEAFLTLQGYIVISLGFFEQSEGIDVTKEQERLFEEIHYRKIDLSDEIFVVNVNGYIGNSTQNEINYAISNGKSVRYYTETKMELPQNFPGKILSKQGSNADIGSQINLLCDIISKNDYVYEVCDKARQLGLRDYYIGAGCLAQTVWNYLSGKTLHLGIKDIDFVYFDYDLSYEREDKVVERVGVIFQYYPLKIDVKNQARVHLWYKDHFGHEIKPYSTLEEAINTWPTTSTAIGVRLSDDNSWKVYAPFGLNDLFSNIVRANKAQITKELYEKKTKRWLSVWPDLTVIPW